MSYIIDFKYVGNFDSVPMCC